MTPITKTLNQAKISLILNNSVVLFKECKTERIEYEFTTDTSRTFCNHKMKRYYPHDKMGECKKVKNMEIFKPINDLINDDIYDLLIKGYKLK